MGSQILYYEAGRTQYAQHQLTDQGDHMDYRSASIQYLSDYNDGTNDYGPVIRPDGVLSGGIPTPGSANNTVDVTALSAYLAGTWYGTGGDSAAIAASTITITRGTAGNPYKINSITLASNGAFAVVAGTPSTGNSATTRGSAGAPPVIPLKSIEICQIWTSASTAAVLTTTEIKQIVGTHREDANYPPYTTKFANVDNGTLGYAGVDFVSANTTIHTGGVTRGVWMSGYDASFAEWVDAYDFTPPTTTGSLSSTTTYTREIGAVDTSLSEGSFSWVIGNPHTDSQMVVLKRKIWLKHKKDKLKNPATIVQGYVFGGPTNPATGNDEASMTVVSEVAAERLQ